MHATASSWTTQRRPARARLSAAEAMGQIVGLLSHSPRHCDLPIKVVEGSFMPAILTEQYRLFRHGPYPALQDVDPDALRAAGLIKRSLEQLPMGVAIWARLSPTAEAKLHAGEPLTIQEWQSGKRVWLIDLICPFATKQNHLSEAMMLDLVQGPFASKPFNVLCTDPVTGQCNQVRMDCHVRSVGLQ